MEGRFYCKNCRATLSRNSCIVARPFLNQHAEERRAAITSECGRRWSSATSRPRVIPRSRNQMTLTGHAHRNELARAKRSA